MNDTAQYLLFIGLLCGSAVSVWLWVRWRLKLDADEALGGRRRLGGLLPAVLRLALRHGSEPFSGLR